MRNYTSFIEIDETESREVHDKLLDDHRFQRLVLDALDGELTCQELGYEILLRAEAIAERQREDRKFWKEQEPLEVCDE